VDEKRTFRSRLNKQLDGRQLESKSASMLLSACASVLILLLQGVDEPRSDDEWWDVARAHVDLALKAEEEEDSNTAFRHFQRALYVRAPHPNVASGSQFQDWVKVDYPRMKPGAPKTTPQFHADAVPEFEETPHLDSPPGSFADELATAYANTGHWHAAAIANSALNVGLPLDHHRSQLDAAEYGHSATWRRFLRRRALGYFSVSLLLRPFDADTRAAVSELHVTGDEGLRHELGAFNATLCAWKGNVFNAHATAWHSNAVFDGNRLSVQQDRFQESLVYYAAMHHTFPVGRNESVRMAEFYEANNQGRGNTQAEMEWASPFALYSNLAIALHKAESLPQRARDRASLLALTTAKMFYELSHHKLALYNELLKKQWRPAGFGGFEEAETLEEAVPELFQVALCDEGEVAEGMPMVNTHENHGSGKHERATMRAMAQGVLLMASNAPYEAVQYFRTAARAADDVLRMMGLSRLAADEEPKGARGKERLTLKPWLSIHHTQLAWALHASGGGDTPECRAALKRALELDPEDLKAQELWRAQKVLDKTLDDDDEEEGGGGGREMSGESKRIRTQQLAEEELRRTVHTAKRLGKKKQSAASKDFWGRLDEKRSSPALRRALREYHRFHREQTRPPPPGKGGDLEAGTIAGGNGLRSLNGTSVRGRRWLVGWVPDEGAGMQAQVMVSYLLVALLTKRALLLNWPRRGRWPWRRLGGAPAERAVKEHAAWQIMPSDLEWDFATVAGQFNMDELGDWGGAKDRYGYGGMGGGGIGGFSEEQVAERRAEWLRHSKKCVWHATSAFKTFGMLDPVALESFICGDMATALGGEDGAKGESGGAAVAYLATDFPLWPMLQEHPKYAPRLHELFGRGPDFAVRDTFQPLLQWLIRPSANVVEEASAFAEKHFLERQKAGEVIVAGLHLRMGIHRNAFGADEAFQNLEGGTVQYEGMVHRALEAACGAIAYERVSRGIDASERLQRQGADLKQINTAAAKARLVPVMLFVTSDRKDAFWHVNKTIMENPMFQLVLRGSVQGAAVDWRSGAQDRLPQREWPPITEEEVRQEQQATQALLVHTEWDWIGRTTAVGNERAMIDAMILAQVNENTAAGARYP
jgi:hypothetical protein